MLDHDLVPQGHAENGPRVRPKRGGRCFPAAADWRRGYTAARPYTTDSRTQQQVACEAVAESHDETTPNVPLWCGRK
jgi:hypothetical protein